MKSGCRMLRAPGNGREGRGHGQAPDRWQSLAILLCIALVLATVAAIWSHPAGLARAQDENAASDMPLPGQVIAQGIARLPRDEVAWTVRGIDVSADASTAVESFPVGFAIADVGTIALLDADGEVLNILATGEAAFLPNGRSGALSSWEAGAASLYEVALVSGAEATAGETAGSVVGEPFATPEGAAFDIELARETLTPGEQATIPISRSGTPVLLLQTAGSVQLEASNGQIVELTAGQFAMLTGEVLAHGASDGPSTFVIAAIGEATAARDVAAAGTPETRAGREERRQAREATQAETAAPGENAPSAEGTRERRPRRDRTGGGGGGGGGGGRGGGGGQGGQTAPQGTGGTDSGTVGVPITGAVDPTVPAGLPAETPALEPTPEPTLPADTTAPGAGTPSPDATTPPDDEAAVDETAVPGDEAPADTTVTPEPTAPAGDVVPTEAPSAGDAVPTEETSEAEPAPTVQAPPAVETPPLEEVPGAEAAPTEPVVEEEATEPAAGA